MYTESKLCSDPPPFPPSPGIKLNRAGAQCLSVYVFIPWGYTIPAAASPTVLPEAFHPKPRVLPKWKDPLPMWSDFLES